MDVCYFSDLTTRAAYRAVYDLDNAHLYLEALAPTDPLPCSRFYEPEQEADLGCFAGGFDRQLFSNVAAGMVAVGRARFLVPVF